jgi:hypothetical protein
MPELKRQRVTLLGLVFMLGLRLGAESYSLSTAQIYNDFRLSVILTEKSVNHLLYGMDSHAVATIDEWVTSNIGRGEWFVEIGFVAKIQLGDASFGDDAAVVCLYAESVP